MAHEDLYGSVAIDNLSAGTLLDARLWPVVQAVTGLESHGVEGGGISTLDNASSPHSLDDVGVYQPGIDPVTSIDVANSLRSKVVYARKGRADETPQRYHAVIEYGDRYRQATGEYSLYTLARVGLATVCLATQQAGVNMDTRVVVDGQKPLRIESEEFSAPWTLGRYEKYVKGLKPNPRPAGKALAKGLEDLRADEESFSVTTDFVVVISDFLGGEERKRGHLVGFNWLSSLRALHSDLGDRLLVLRLTTPAQRTLPNVQTIEVEGQVMTFDQGEHAAVSDRYKQIADEKATFIGRALAPIRYFEVRSTDPKPLVSVPSFIFARPPQQTD